MKKHIWLIIIAVVLLFIIGATVYIGSLGVKDHSARYSGIGYNGPSDILWSGKTYKHCGFDHDIAFSTGKAVADFGNDYEVIREIKNDPEHNYIIVTSFRERDLYVSSDYTPPEDGNVTGIYIDKIKRNNDKLLEALEKIYSTERDEFFLYEVQDSFYRDKKIKVKKVHFVYDDCPVATGYKGYLGKVDGVWCFIDDFPGYRAFQKEIIPCFEIDEEFIPVLEKYF